MYNPTMRETYGATRPPGVSPPYIYTIDISTAGSEGHTQPPPYEPPPSDTAITQPPPYEPPPSDTAIIEIKQARTESNGCLEFLKKGLVSVLLPLGTLGLGIWLALSIMMIVIGSVHLHDSPKDRFIPVYFIVGGCFIFLQKVMSLCHRAQDSDSTGNLGDDVKQSPITCLIDRLISCFLVAWFVCGCVWVYVQYLSAAIRAVVSFAAVVSPYL
ncbi:PREDICTED: uncharacterized protein LOC106818853 [Priapulus caudatus]|uniref:Uncharacterized protein LOC106818853 n=1 Tax=Priapulus caudatus TaxID=37621 RepID=A0ABM1F3J1_PRICU|nr:PREDICTED: uncharacterized protein LOC106818853 [Priapulus caudatus]